MKITSAFGCSIIVRNREIIIMFSSFYEANITSILNICRNDNTRPVLLNILVFKLI